MLTRLMPDQVSKFWDVIKYAIEETLPPIAGSHPNRTNRILTSLLCDKTICWASYERDNDDIVLNGIVITKIIYDEPSHTKSLLIYCAYGYREMNNNTWIEVYKALNKYAILHNCSCISGYTNVKRIVEVVKGMGGNTEYSYISLDVNESIKDLNKFKE